ncbi:MAG: lipopolysaccharide heptosyltransferase I [bacterium]|nr:lipopolysaccharide heptosyltransferase I [bacterium]
MNILIIKPSSLGDVVQALPVLKVLHERYPGAHIDWLVNEEIADILSGNPFLRTVHLWDRTSWRKPRLLPAAIRRTARLLRRLRRERYDLVLDLQGLLRSSLMARLSGGREIVGFADARELAPLFYHKKVRAPVAAMHSVERYILAVGGNPSRGRQFPIVFSAREKQSAERLFTQAKRDTARSLVVFVVGARWATKQWPPENFAALAEKLAASDGAQVALIGSQSEAPLACRIASTCGCAMMDFSGKTTLKQLAYLFQGAKVVVGNDSGPTHIAAAVGTPVVALYGPTSPVRTGPYGEQHTVLTTSLPCSPCFRRTCDQGTSCMTDISVESVYRACKPYLQKREHAVTQQRADRRAAPRHSENNRRKAATGRDPN